MEKSQRCGAWRYGDRSRFAVDAEDQPGMPYVEQRRLIGWPGRQIPSPCRQRRHITSPRRKVTSLHRRLVHTPQDRLSLDNAAGSSTAIAWKHTRTLSAHDSARRCRLSRLDSTTTHRCRMFDEFNLQIRPQINHLTCRYRPKIIWFEIVTNLRLRELLIMFVLLDVINLDHK